MRTNQLPEPELGYIQTDKSNQPAFSARQMREAMQARAQVQGEACPTCGETEPYTGSCGTSNNDTKALCKQPPQATQAEVTDAEIEALFGKCGGHWSGDQWVIEDADIHPFARAILALRPERVPMTEDQVWHNDALMSANGTAGFKMDALMRIVRAAETHHGIKPKE